MKQTLVTTFKALTAVAAVAVIVSVAHAWTGPTGTFPTGDVAAPVNTGSVNQSKNADLYLTALTGSSGTGSLYAQSFVVGLKRIIGGEGFFGCNTLGCIGGAENGANGNVFNAGVFNGTGNLTQGTYVDASGDSFMGNPTGLFNLPDSGIMVLKPGTSTIGNNIVSGGLSIQPSPTSCTSGSCRTDLLHLFSGTGVNYSTILTNVPNIEFWSTVGSGERANVQVNNADLNGTIRIGGGNPSAGAILGSTDSNGNATWGTISLPSPDLVVVGAQQTAANVTEYAYCPSGSVLVGGGGSCHGQQNGYSSTMSESVSFSSSSNQEPGVSPSQTTTSLSQFNAWKVGCGNVPNLNTYAYAYAICMKAGTATFTQSVPSSPGLCNDPQATNYNQTGPCVYGTLANPTLLQQAVIPGVCYWRYNIVATGGTPPITYSGTLTSNPYGGGSIIGSVLTIKAYSGHSETVAGTLSATDSNNVHTSATFAENGANYGGLSIRQQKRKSGAKTALK